MASRGIYKLLSAGGLVAMGMLFGRVLGLVREMTLASRFGIGETADFVIFLLIIPDFITIALIGYAASAVLVPAFTAREKDARARLFWQSVGLTGLLGALLFVLLAAAGYFMLDNYGYATQQAYDAFFVMLLALPVSAVTAVLTAYLQYAKRLTVPSFANGIFNLALIAVLLLVAPSMTVVAWGIMFACGARLLAHAVAVWREGQVGLRISLTPLEYDRALVRSYLHALAGCMLNVLPVYTPYFILGATDGLALFNYANKLVMLPATLGFSMITMLLLPWLSASFKADNGTQFQQDCKNAILLITAIGFSLSLTLSFAAALVSTLIFGYGNMQAQDVADVAKVFSRLVWVMPLMLIANGWQQVHYATHNTKIPLNGSIIQASIVVSASVAGYAALGISGIVGAIILGQAALVFYLAREAKKAKIIAHMTPSISTLAMLGAVTIFLSMANLMIVRTDVAFLIRLSFYVVAGAIALLISMGIHPTLKQWIKACLSRQAA